MAVMSAKYPAIRELADVNREHIADACAAFEAARNSEFLENITDLEVTKGDWV
jgi:hypothetical protein